MVKRVVLVGVLVLGISLASSAGVLDRFVASYGTGNLHTLFFTDPVNLIELLGEEPTSYDYYSSGEHIFTYVEPDALGELKTLAIIWEVGSIQEIRIGFVDGTTVGNALKVLGYTEGFFSEQETTDQRLGNVPYHARVFTAEDTVKLYETSSAQDVVFMFLINHFKDSIYMLVIQHQY